MPAIISVAGLLAFIPLAIKVNALFLSGAVAFMALAYGAWLVCDRLDKAIPRSKARIRKLSEQLVARLSRFANVMGLDPALSPAVGKVLDESAGIYLKHSPDFREDQANPFSENHLKAVRALEEAMARMLELATPQTVRAQELELSRGWAVPLLQEMRALDRALDEHARAMLHDASNAPLVGLREARLDLQGLGTALDELEQARSENEVRG